MSLKLQFNQQSITNFTSPTMATAISPVVQIAAMQIPEPATLILLGIGSILFARKR
jgi:hypothetical protein